MSCGVPPEAFTRYIPCGAPNRMTPSAFHDPPVVHVSLSGASEITIGVLPLRSTLFSLPVEKNPIDLLSGDQNGKSAPSVPAIRRPSRAFNGRSHNAGASFAVATRNTT